MSGKRRSPASWAGAVLMAAGFVFLVLALYMNRLWPFGPPEGVQASPRDPAIFAVPEEDPPGDKLFISTERQQYQSGTLRLVIPQLELDLAIQNGVYEASLEQGPGLYDYAQLPGTGNRNVSIAGHRDIHGSPFYYVDTLTDNDYLYLIYDGTVYRYTYKSTTIVADDDWGPIYSQGFSCLTLTSCDPIGTTQNRIIVQAELSQRTPYRSDDSFEAAYQP